MKLSFLKIIQNNVKGYWLLYLPLVVVYIIGYAIDRLLFGV
jgi:hypothetical protein